MTSKSFYGSLVACVLPLCACGSTDGGERTEESASKYTLPCGSVGTTMGLIAENGNYVTADLGYYDTPLLAESNHLEQWERFTIVDAGDGFVALLSHANSLYVSADLNNGGALEAGWATTIQGWEKFRIQILPEHLGQQYIDLQSYANARFVSANLGQSGTPLEAAWATTVQSWEEFLCVPQ